MKNIRDRFKSIDDSFYEDDLDTIINTVETEINGADEDINQIESDLDCVIDCLVSLQFNNDTVDVSEEIETLRKINSLFC